MTKLLSAYLFCLLLYFKFLSTVTCQDGPSTTTTTEKSVSAIPKASSDTSSTTTIVTTSTITTTALPPAVINISGNPFTWSSLTEDGNNSIVVRVDPGRFISVTVSDVDMADGNFLLIEKGDSHDKDSTDGRVFANTVAGPYSYLFRDTEVYAFCQFDKGTKHNFKVKFEEIDAPTTTEAPTTSTTIILPTTAKGDSAYITVNVGGYSLEEYRVNQTQNRIKAFKYCIRNMATKYCEDKSINLTQNITDQHVRIESIRSCPYNWPDSKTCVKIKFRLPIDHEESDHKYRLSSNELEYMWVQWKELDGGCFQMNNFTVYTEPNVEASITWWAVGIAFVIVFFVVLLWFLRTFSSRLKTAIQNRKRRNSGSDTISIMSRQTNNSVCSLTPHYLQDHLDTPKFFET